MTGCHLLWRRVYTAARLAKRGVPTPRFDLSDVAQESLIQLWEEVRARQGRSVKFSDSYLRSVGAGHAKQQLRLHSAARRSMRAEGAGEISAQLVSDDEGPLELLQDRERIVVVIRAIGQLAADQQLVVYRRLFDHRTVADIAAELEVTIDVVRGQFAVGMRRLRFLLREIDPGGPAGRHVTG